MSTFLISGLSSFFLFNYPFNKEETLEQFIQQNGLDAGVTIEAPTLSESINPQPTKGGDSFIQQNGLTAIGTMLPVQPQNGWTPLSGRIIYPELFFEP